MEGGSDIVVIMESLSRPSKICTRLARKAGKAEKEEAAWTDGWMHALLDVLGCLYPSEIQFLIYHGQRPRPPAAPAAWWCVHSGIEP